ncbi:hypothetical protein AgCh_021002 [Apium graveolens]
MMAMSVTEVSNFGNTDDLEISDTGYTPGSAISSSKKIEVLDFLSGRGIWSLISQKMFPKDVANPDW